MPSTTTNADGTILRDATSRYRKRQREEDDARGAFDGEIRRAGGSPRSDVDVRRGVAPAQVAALLGVDADTEVAIRARRMFDGGRLVQIATTYVPTDVAEAAGIEQVDTGVGGIISRMADAGFPQVDAVEEVTQGAANADEAEGLGVQAGDQLMTITHVGQTADGRVVEVTIHRLGPGWILRYGVPLS